MRNLLNPLSSGDVRSVVLAPYAPVGRTASPNLGAANKIEAVCNGLSSHGEVLLVNTAHNRVGLAAGKINAVGRWREYDLPSFGVRKFGKLAHIILSFLMAKKVSRVISPNIIWVYNSFSADVLIALSLKRKFPESKIVLELEDWPNVRRRRGVGVIKQTLDMILLRRIISCADVVTLVNPRMKKYKELCGVDNCIMFPGVISEELVGLRRERIALSGKNICVGYFGGLNYEKGADIFLSAIERLCSVNGGDVFSFVVCGSGVYLERAVALSESYPGRVRVESELSKHELYTLMFTCDILVNPHRSLGDNDGILPFKVIEALAVGAFLISTDLPNEVIPEWAYKKISCDESSLCDAILNAAPMGLQWSSDCAAIAAEYSESVIISRVLSMLGEPCHR